MYINYDENGEYGFYSLDIHGKEVIAQCIEITEELYNYLLDNQGKYIVDINSVKDTITIDNFIERPSNSIQITPTKEELQQSEYMVDLDYRLSMIELGL